MIAPWIVVLVCFLAQAFFAVAELLKSGVTTFTDYSAPRPGWLEDIASTGIRGCIAPSYRSARWSTPNGSRVEYAWDEGAGRAAMAEALEIVDRAANHASGRLFGMVAPAQVDTCSAELIEASVIAAKAREEAFDAVFDYFTFLFRSRSRDTIEGNDD